MIRAAWPAIGRTFDLSRVPTLAGSSRDCPAAPLPRERVRRPAVRPTRTYGSCRSRPLAAAADTRSADPSASPRPGLDLHPGKSRRAGGAASPDPSLRCAGRARSLTTPQCSLHTSVCRPVGRNPTGFHLPSPTGSREAPDGPARHSDFRIASILTEEFRVLPPSDSVFFPPRRPFHRRCPSRRRR